jgi:uncharacterized membrane protein YtjA (UPF0391 family)
MPLLRMLPRDPAEDRPEVASRDYVRSNSPEVIMLYWALVFLIVALVAGVLGFGGIAAAAAGIAKILFYIFLVIFLVTLIMGLAGRSRV